MPVTIKTRTLSEAASKALLSTYGIPFLEERLAPDASQAGVAAQEIGFPVVAKLSGDKIAHKTERGLVRLNLNSADEVERAAQDLLDAAVADDGDVEVLIAPMVRGLRELIVGVQRDAQFGPTVLVGIGGVLAEALGDVAIGLAPLQMIDAHEMLHALANQQLLAPLRGEPEVNRETMASILTALSTMIGEHDEVVSVDVNPLIVVDGQPVAVDALVEVIA